MLLFEDDKTAAETHYDAVWLRDSLWGYMALVNQGNSVAAKKVLLTLWDYMLTPDQIKRMQDVISNPGKRPDGVPGQMNVYIRI